MDLHNVMRMWIGTHNWKPTVDEMTDITTCIHNILLCTCITTTCFEKIFLSILGKFNYHVRNQSVPPIHSTNNSSTCLHQYTIVMIWYTIRNHYTCSCTPVCSPRSKDLSIVANVYMCHAQATVTVDMVWPYHILGLELASLPKVFQPYTVHLQLKAFLNTCNVNQPHQMTLKHKLPLKETLYGQVT